MPRFLDFPSSPEAENLWIRDGKGGPTGKMLGGWETSFLCNGLWTCALVCVCVCVWWSKQFQLFCKCKVCVCICMFEQACVSHRKPLSLCWWNSRLIIAISNYAGCDIDIACNWIQMQFMSNVMDWTCSHAPGWLFSSFPCLWKQQNPDGSISDGLFMFNDSDAHFCNIT